MKGTWNLGTGGSDHDALSALIEVATRFVVGRVTGAHCFWPACCVGLQAAGLMHKIELCRPRSPAETLN